MDIYLYVYIYIYVCAIFLASLNVLKNMLTSRMREYLYMVIVCV